MPGMYEDSMPYTSRNIGYHTKARAQQEGLGTGDLLDHCEL